MTSYIEYLIPRIFSNSKNRSGRGQSWSYTGNGRGLQLVLDQSGSIQLNSPNYITPAAVMHAGGHRSTRTTTNDNATLIVAKFRWDQLQQISFTDLPFQIFPMLSLSTYFFIIHIIHTHTHTHTHTHVILE